MENRQNYAKFQCNKGKVQQRGYNQAEEFAKYLSHYSNITLDKDITNTSK